MVSVARTSTRNYNNGILTKDCLQLHRESAIVIDCILIPVTELRMIAMSRVVKQCRDFFSENDK